MITIDALPKKYGRTTVVEHGERDPAHEVFAEADLRVHDTGRGEHIAPLNAGFGFAVSAGSEKKELAQAFVKFATSANFHVKALLTVGSGISPDRPPCWLQGGSRATPPVGTSTQPREGSAQLCGQRTTRTCSSSSDVCPSGDGRPPAARCLFSCSIAGPSLQAVAQLRLI